MPTEQQAADAIFGAFNTAWSTNPTYPVVWPNKKPDVEVMKQGNPWAFVKVNHASGKKISLNGADSTSLWQRKGMFVCEIYTASGIGTELAYTLARLVEMAFLGKTIGGVVFRGIKIKEGGMHGNWFLINVNVDFEYDEIV